MRALIKPKRSFSRVATVINTAIAWAMIVWAGTQDLETLKAVLPYMMMIIIGGLAGYQTIGHFDLRTQVQNGAAPQPVAADDAPDEPRS